jgi:hypothetical protein
MIVIPCSVGTLARIANGIASHLCCACARRHSTKSTSATCTGPPTPGPRSFP